MRQRGRALDAHDRVDKCRKGPEPAYREVLDGAQRLHAVECVGRYLARAERVALGSGAQGDTGVGISKVEIMLKYEFVARPLTCSSAVRSLDT